MQKKQASLNLPLYIFCTLLILALAASFLIPSGEEESGDPVSEEIVVHQEDERFTLPEEITQIETMKELQKNAEDIAGFLQDPLVPEEFFANEFSVFTTIEEEPKRGINVVTLPRADPPEKITPMEGEVRVVIIIDDMGISRKWSKKIAELEGPLTLSYLPYAEDLQAQADYAVKHRHHLMLHMPMEAMNGAMGNTPGLLKTNATQHDFLDSFYKNLSSFNGFSGINNHMGSRLTQDKTKMNLVMAALKKEGLYFVDSKTIHTSIAGETAEEEGVPCLVRDVFLDHEDNYEYVKAALSRLERKAVDNGVAIAIGHPKEATYIALKEWLPTLKRKNISLVHAGSIIQEKYPDVSLISYQAHPQEPLPDIIPAAGHKVVEAGAD